MSAVDTWETMSFVLSCHKNTFYLRQEPMKTDPFNIHFDSKSNRAIFFFLNVKNCIGLSINVDENWYGNSLESILL